MSIIEHWRSYRLEDFIPFTAEVYFRLIERVNEALWPAQFVAIALGLLILILAWRGRRRLTLALLAPAWLCSGMIFHFNYYSELNVLADIFAYSFLAQMALLLLLAAWPGNSQPVRRPGRARSMAGLFIAISGVFAWPLIGPIAGSGWQQAEFLALHPDPTAIATLGLVVLTLRGSRAWLALIIPALWCLVTTLTLSALGIPWAWLTASLALMAIVLSLLPQPRPHRLRNR